jgi:hypothetical protein
MLEAPCQRGPRQTETRGGARLRGRKACHGGAAPEHRQQQRRRLRCGDIRGGARGGAQRIGVGVVVQQPVSLT